MGSNIVRRLLRHQHKCVVFDQNPNAVASLANEAESAQSLKDVCEKLSPPRIVWIMLPAGSITEQMVMSLADMLAPGDVIVDGGNSYFKDDIRRAAMLKSRKIHYVDAGVSGGVWGLDRGYCMMMGGDQETIDRLDPIFAALAPGNGDIARTPGRESRDPRIERGYMHCGPSGAGHFVKMVHNGIEYGLMQAYAEGFDILRGAAANGIPEAWRYALDLADIAEVWRRGSVVSSWLLDLSAAALAEDSELREFRGDVEDSGEGRWTVLAAVEEAISAEVITAALYARFRSRHGHTFAEKLLSAMRNKFGGHIERKSNERVPG